MPRPPFGFTLIELLIVIAIISILIGASIPIYDKYKINAIKTSGISDLRNCISHIAIHTLNVHVQDKTQQTV